MLKRLYNWTLSLAARKSAQWWLGVISFVESSVFLVPAEALLVPMGLARPERAYRYALIATVGSVLGGVAGWLLGYYAYELIARPVLEFYGSLDKFEMLRSSSSRDAILLMLITSGIAHLPPMKVVTILSGAAAVNGWLFVSSAILARGGKFLVIAWLLRRYGEPIRDFIERRLGLVALAVLLGLVLVYFAIRLLFGPGT
jgi:membrane protein YqaA with SNARE-associated domain